MHRTKSLRPAHRLARRGLRIVSCLLLGALALSGTVAHSAEPANAKQLEAAYSSEIQPLIKRFCHECHAGERTEAEIDLTTFDQFAKVRKDPLLWQKMGEMLDSGQMPPPDSPQPTEAEKVKLEQWVRSLLLLEAAAHAGDPGPVVLRRLNNAEYTFTLRDLTGIGTLDAAKEFPVDSAAGEGFTNVGNALAMSPALLTKYLDAAKAVSEHAVLLPDGIRFSPATTRRDWTNESLARIREFYGQFTSTGGGSAVNLQGVQFSTNAGGRLPVEAYLSATLHERAALASGQKTFAAVAQERGLNAKYLQTLWTMLNQESKPQALPLDALRTAWRNAKPEDAPALAKLVASWQDELWQFHAVGQIGRAGRGTKWQMPKSPLVSRQDFKIKLPNATSDEIVLYLAASDAGDGAVDDVVVWERPRFVAPGRPELLLRDVRRVAHELAARRQRHFAQAANCLNAAAEASAAGQAVDVAALAAKHKVDAEFLADWLKFLGIQGEGTRLGTPIEQTTKSGGGHDFIQGWVGPDALSVLANSSDQHVRIPGNMKPHSIAVHPAPQRSVAVAWQSPIVGSLKISGAVQHAHPECGNGVAWSLELRRGALRQRLASGFSQGAKEVPIGPLEKIAIQQGDAISLVIDPRNNNHSCDLTAIDLTLHDGTREWNLAREVSPNILAGNPQPDAHRNKAVWHFYSNPTDAASTTIPPDSLLAQWQIANPEDKPKLAAAVQQLLTTGAAALPKDSADAALYEQLTSLSGPLMTSALRSALEQPTKDVGDDKSTIGLNPTLFGVHPAGKPVDAASLCLQAPQTLEIRIPAALVAGAEFVSGGALHADAGDSGSVQLQVLTSKPDVTAIKPDSGIITRAGSAAHQRIEAALDEFRQLFPVALCYPQIVPVDEVVTLTLFYREDEHLQRLMLSDEQIKQLDRYWDELLFVVQEPLEMVTAFDQLSEFATQDRPDIVKELEPLRASVHARGAAFRQRLIDCEPAQFDALIAFAGQAYRRPLSERESEQIRTLYARLRKEEMHHEEAWRLTLARVLVSPAFLYRLEQPGPGEKATAVSDWELASRLSYFLWSSQPDQELRELAAAGQLRNPDVLAAQAKRMLRDPKARRLATEFACQWLQIYEFDQLDEKSERHFPTFAGLRGAMYEESILFLTDLFQNDRSVLNLLHADYTFLNEDLAKHYGIPGVSGPQWRRVEGVAKHGRGGVLAQAAPLAKQSGASRTSPILRGTWLSEVMLGEKMPPPPKGVPILADTIPEGLTERELTERHSVDPACVTCHRRIDPFGFALENFDAIGRYRQQDAAGLTIDSKTVVPDGTAIEGLPGLQKYLLTSRKNAFVRQFNRKLLGYALGRAVRISDEPLLVELQAMQEQNDYSVVATVEQIVRSPQFRMIRGQDAPTE